MKRIMISLLCLTVMLLSVSCEQKQEPQAEDYSISKATQPLSDKDIVSCFKALGLHLERFTCLLPERSGVTLSSQEYKKGQERGGKSSGTTYVEKGLQEFILFMKEDSNRVNFTLASSTGRVGCGSASVEPYHSKTWGWIPIKKLSQDKQPVFVYAANIDNNIDCFSPSSANIETVVAKHDFVIVVYASIASKE